jgi:DNA-binding XRE family transcriptional regulator
MTRKYIPADELIDRWMQNPEFVKEYDALEEEFALASALIEARGRANLTQEQVAERMGTTQANVARIEGGSSLPSTRTLARYAKATGHRLRFAFVPDGKRHDVPAR